MPAKCVICDTNSDANSVKKVLWTEEEDEEPEEDEENGSQRDIVNSCKFAVANGAARTSLLPPPASPQEARWGAE